MENGAAVARPRWADLSNSDDDEDDSLSSSTMGDRSPGAPTAPARRPRNDPPRASARQRLRPEDLPEVDALHRIEKRTHVIATVKQSKEYRAQRLRVAKTPDPTDRTFGKRRWDEAVVAWKMSLRSSYEADAAAAPIDSDACRTMAAPAAAICDVPMATPLVSEDSSLSSRSSRRKDFSVPKLALLAILTLGQFLLLKRGASSSSTLAIFQSADLSLPDSIRAAPPGRSLGLPRGPLAQRLQRRPRRRSARSGLDGASASGDDRWVLDLGEDELDDRYDLFLDADSYIDDELLSKRPVYQECHSTSMMMTTALGMC